MKKYNFETLSPVLPKDFLINNLRDLYNNGLPRGLELGVEPLDNLCRIDSGRLVLVTGVPNHGKSEFVDFMTAQLNKRYGMKTLYFSPENQPHSFHLAKIVSKFTNKKLDSSALSMAEFEQAANYVCDNFFFFNYEKVHTIDEILSEAKKMIDNYGVKIIVADAYNKIESSKTDDVLETDFISKLLDKLCQFSISNDIIFILVAHPRKMEYREGRENEIRQCKCPSAYDINGSANFFNKADFIFVVHRDFANDETLIKVEKVKFSNYGKVGTCKLKRDEVSGNYTSITEIDPYEWEEEASVSSQQPSFSFPTITNSDDPLNVSVSFYQNYTAATSQEIVNLKEFLMSGKYRGIIDTIRSGSTPEERHSLKDQHKLEIPCVTLSGVFSQRANNGLQTPTDLIALDIDYKDNKDIIEKVPEILQGLDYVAYYSKSITGDGYFAIVKIDSHHNHTAHFRSLVKEMREYGITLDSQCKDIARLRMVSYDSEHYYNPFASTYYRVLDEKSTTATQSSSSNRKYVSTATKVNTDKFELMTPTKTLEENIERLKSSGHSIPDDYNTWFNLAMSLSTLGESGRSYFHELSSRSPKYDAAGCDKQFDECLQHYSGNNKYTLGTAIKIISDAI